MSALTPDQQAIYDAVMAQLTENRSAVESLRSVSAIGNEDVSLPLVNNQGELVTILISSLVSLSAQNLSQSLALWAGEASPSTNPGTSPYNKVYLACSSGTYTNFTDEAGHAIVLADGEVALIRRAGAYWVKETLNLLNKTYALAAANNANQAATNVNDWFGADDAHGIRKTWSDWFSDTLSNGVRKRWTDWFNVVQDAWNTWFGATTGAGVRKTWSDWYNAAVTAWNGFFGTSANDANGVRKIWSTWYSGRLAEWSSLASGVQDAADDANSAAQLANEKAGLANSKATLANDKAALANEKAGLANTAANYANTQAGRAKKYADHPPMMGDNGNWWVWDEVNDEYADSGVLAKGGVLYPSFMVDPATMHLVMNIQDEIAASQFSLDETGHLHFNYM